MDTSEPCGLYVRVGGKMCDLSLAEATYYLLKEYGIQPDVAIDLCWCLANQPETSREVFFWKLLGYPQNQIARRVNRHESTVSRTVHHRLDCLVSLLEYAN